MKLLRLERNLLVPFWRHAGHQGNAEPMEIIFHLTIKVIFFSSLKPIFHWKLGSRWVPNAKEIYTKNMKYRWPTPEFCVGTQCNLYSTDWRRGLALGLTQILGLASRGLASGNANSHILDTNMLVSPTQKSGVGGTAQRQPPTPGILRSGGI